MTASARVVVYERGGVVRACRVRTGRTWRLGRRFDPFASGGYSVDSAVVAGRHVAYRKRKQVIGSGVAGGYSDRLFWLNTKKRAPVEVPVGCTTDLPYPVKVESYVVSRLASLAWQCVASGDLGYRQEVRASAACGPVLLAAHSSTSAYDWFEDARIALNETSDVLYWTMGGRAHRALLRVC